MKRSVRTRHSVELPAALSLALTLLLASSLMAQSLEEARRLRASGDPEAAIEVLRTIVESDAGAEEKAQALDLMGDVALDGEDLTLASDAWGRMVTEYPDAAAAAGAETKLKLAEALIESRGEQPVREKPPTAKPPRAEPRERPPAPAAASRVEAPAPPPAVERPAPKAARPTVAPGVVLVAGGGQPHDAALEATGIVMESLSGSGVDLMDATEGLPVIRQTEALLPSLVGRARQEGASGFLILTWEFAAIRKAVAECYTADGTELWRVKVSGGTGVTGRSKAPSGIVMELVDRLNDKLKKKVGGPGLPVASN